MPDNMSGERRDRGAPAIGGCDRPLSDSELTSIDAKSDSITFASEDTAEGFVVPIAPDLTGGPPADLYDRLETQSDSQSSAPPSHPERRNKRLAIEKDLALMIAANRDARPERIYSGFYLVRAARALLREEQLYAGAFLPLQTARKFPELLALESIDYSHAYCNETLPVGTRIVIRPGIFQEIVGDDSHLPWASPLALLAYALVAATFIGLLTWWRQ